MQHFEFVWSIKKTRRGLINKKNTRISSEAKSKNLNRNGETPTASRRGFGR
jgi:hypothetical protein